MDKVKKCFYFLLSIFSCFLLSLTTFSPANAISLTHGSAKYPTAQSYLRHGFVVDSSAQDIYAVTTTSDGAFYNIPPNRYITDIHLQLDSDIPANSLFSFQIYYRVYSSGGQVTPNIEYYGLNSGSGWTLLADSCVNPDGQNTFYGTVSIPTGSSYQYSSDFSCSYVGFTNVALNNFSLITPDSRLVYFRNQQSALGDTSNNISGQVILSPFSTRQINFNSLTADDRAWLLENMPAGSSSADIESAIESAKESEKEEIQDASDESEDTANDAQDYVDSATSSLLSVLTSFVGVITSASPTNCYLDGSIFPHLNLGRLNLCENSPPAPITALGSLLLIAFVIPLVYNTIKMIINLFSEFQR